MPLTFGLPELDCSSTSALAALAVKVCVEVLRYPPEVSF